MRTFIIVLKKQDPRIGYMNCIEKLWDEIYPEHTQLSSKVLRDQTSRIEKRKNIPETQPNEQRETITVNNENRVDNNRNGIDINYDRLNDNVNDNDNDQSGEIDHNSNRENNENNQMAINDVLKEQLSVPYLRNYNIYHEKDVNDRLIYTKANKTITKETLQAANVVIKEHLNTIDSPTLWDVNCSIYSIALACKELNDDIKEINNQQRKKDEPKWIVNLKNSIERTRKLIAHTQVVIKCTKDNNFTQHQRNLKNKLFKKFRSKRVEVFQTKLTILQQELKSKTERLRYQKKLFERKRINRQFAANPKKLYRSMKGDTIEIENPPKKDEIEEFWKSVWQDPADFNENADWLPDLQETYCPNATSTDYHITQNDFDKIIRKLHLSKSPGQDKIVPFWFKHLNGYRDILVHIFDKMIYENAPLPEWFSSAHISLLPKSNETHIAKNYRPIACLNIQYKLYTSCLNTFLTDHIEKNNIITQEQAAGKKGVWGTIEQLLINKNIMKEVKSLRRNLYTVWLDYKKAFDSIPHKWLLKSLELTKVPDHLINAIKNLTESWHATLHLNGKNETCLLYTSPSPRDATLSRMPSSA